MDIKDTCAHTLLLRKSHSYRCVIATTPSSRQDSIFARGKTGTPGRHPLFSKKGKNQGKKEGQKDAGGKGEIESEIFTLDGNITWESAEPGNFIGEKQEHTQCGHQAAEND